MSMLAIRVKLRDRHQSSMATVRLRDEAKRKIGSLSTAKSAIIQIAVVLMLAKLRLPLAASLPDTLVDPCKY